MGARRIPSYNGKPKAIEQVSEPQLVDCRIALLISGFERWNEAIKTASLVREFQQNIELSYVGVGPRIPVSPLVWTNKSSALLALNALLQLQA